MIFLCTIKQWCFSFLVKFSLQARYSMHPCSKVAGTGTIIGLFLNHRPITYFTLLLHRYIFSHRCCFATCKTYPNADRPQIVSDPNFSLFCKVFNAIYTIKCNLCNMQYIGQTFGPLHKRINQHRSVQILITTHLI